MHTRLTLNHETHNSTLSIRNKQVLISKPIIFSQENIIHKEANQFLLATKPYSQTNKLQAYTCIKIRHPAYIQATNNIIQPTKLELGQKSKRVIYHEFPIPFNTRQAF
jgi:hypothetical protein